MQVAITSRISSIFHRQTINSFPLLLSFNPQLPWFIYLSSLRSVLAPLLFTWFPSNQGLNYHWQPCWWGLLCLAKSTVAHFGHLRKTLNFIRKSIAMDPCRLLTLKTLRASAPLLESHLEGWFHQDQRSSLLK